MFWPMSMARKSCISAGSRVGGSLNARHLKTLLTGAVVGAGAVVGGAVVGGAAAVVLVGTGTAVAVTITNETPIVEVLKLSREKQVTRLPVWEQREQRRRIVGLVNLNSLLYRSDVAPDQRAGTYVQAGLYVDEDMRVEVALRRMQRSGQRLAIVLGREGREIGTLELQDVLEVIFGEVAL